MLRDYKVDILFLDINMPVIDGISFLKTLKNGPEVILTTAYKEYALDGFELSVCDYLLKPFSLERFIVAVDKATEKKIAVISNASHSIQAEEDYLFIKADGKIYKILYEELLYAEAQGNYCKLTTINNILMPAMTFSNFQALVPVSKFVRVHRSFIINISKITHIEGNTVFIKTTEIPIGSNYKTDFLNAIGLTG